MAAQFEIGYNANSGLEPFQSALLIESSGQLNIHDWREELASLRQLAVNAIEQTVQLDL